MFCPDDKVILPSLAVSH